MSSCTMPSRSHPSCTSGKRFKRSRAAASASSSLPALTRSAELVGDRGSLGEARKELGFGRTLLRAAGRDPFRARGLVLGNDLALGRLLLGLTALLVLLTAAAVTGIIASGFGHFGQYLERGGGILVLSPAGQRQLPRAAARL